jgi:hypothetical protein
MIEYTEPAQKNPLFFSFFFILIEKLTEKRFRARLRAFFRLIKTLRLPSALCG